MTQPDRSIAHGKPRPQAAACRDDKRQCLMVIDDDSAIRATLQAALEKQYSVVGLSNGDEALELIESYNPRLLILDINIPGSDGFEISKKVRSKAKLNNLPILFMTVRKDDRSFLSSLDSGGDSFITKPFKISELREKIEYLLRSYQS